MKLRSAFLLLLALTFTLSALAQRGPGGGGGGTRGPSKGAPSLPGASTLSLPDLSPRAVFFTGKVTLDDGSPLTEPVAIQSICNGQKHTEAYSDSHGGFSFQFSNRSTATS